MAPQQRITSFFGNVDQDVPVPFIVWNDGKDQLEGEINQANHQKQEKAKRLERRRRTIRTSHLHYDNDALVLWVFGHRIIADEGHKDTNTDNHKAVKSTNAQNCGFSQQRQ
ncbi:hypothetical protein FQN54_001427 [Arachnomyces sp. PD_36]|nr:hypothetical protein FQN54_001427 [Arachnomyces sp. PD_36]